MAREFAVTAYLFVFRIFFELFKRFPQKKKTTFVASFGDNILFAAQEVEKQTDDQVVILSTSQCHINFKEMLATKQILAFEPSNLINWIQSIYHLATSHKVFVDNYYGFLAASSFRSNVECIQLWHAAGAIKQFGLQDPSNQFRSQRAIDRFHKVYSNFHHVVVGSERMATIFKKSFALSNDTILRTGIPRTDFFYDSEAMNEAKHILEDAFPIIKKKKVILYAPTFRDDNLASATIELDIEKMYKSLRHDYVIFLKLHPAINGTFENKFPGFVFNVSSDYRMNDLLVVADLLITDYSSIPFEYALLQKPMIFFAYDLETYQKTRGFWEDYETLVPGPIAFNTDALIDIIMQASFDMGRVQQFANQWNLYSKGNASKQLIEALYVEEAQQVEQPVNI
ncbi:MULTISPECIES: CDP-glycerol glycerophosphotransferase family protein [unclassified Virgibacillus]|uniref:CDP-glycerol glycerophosphotransferase family protein n=1 Tax=unclassified Virgibacillus TaxID=2620237 RepID=UPI0024DE83EC|nr:CDP-glycerol glycerophosphotransferase family protein [Virgibacillus sp. LDC-1]